MLEVGAQFPDFSLANQDGEIITNQNLAGAKAIIYFYPKDDTSGCTAEACGFRDALPTFEGVRVIGVSPDSVKSHKKFLDKYGLTFDLLADTETTLSTAAGVWVEKSMYGKSYMGVERTTVLLDEAGQIVRVWSKVKVPGHVEEVTAALSA